MGKKRKLDIDITLHDVFRRINQEEQRNLIEIAHEEERLGQNQPAAPTPQPKPRAKRKPTDETKPDKTKKGSRKKNQSSSRS